MTKINKRRPPRWYVSISSWSERHGFPHNYPAVQIGEIIKVRFGKERKGQITVGFFFKHTTGQEVTPPQTADMIPCKNRAEALRLSARYSLAQSMI